MEAVSTTAGSNGAARVVKTICDRCHCACGVLAYVQNGQVVKVEGDKDFPQNEGFLCPKGLSIVQLLNLPERLKYPMKRTGERGEGKWKRISWDEALDTAAAEFRKVLDKYGPNAITWTWGDAAFHVSKVTKQAWLRAMGGSLRFHSDAHYCYHPVMIANSVTFGAFITSEYGMDYANSKCIILWGGNPVVSHPTFARNVMKAKKNGAKLIVIDPRFTEIAAKADLYLQVRPASDDALALGMLNVIINEGLYDHEFVDKWCHGFEQLRDRVQEYPVNRVSELTWVPAEDIVKAARMYATTKPATCHNRLGIQMTTNCVQTLRAVSLLPAVTGNIDISGGHLLPNYPQGFKTLGMLLGQDIALPNLDSAIGSKEYPLLTGSKSRAMDPAHPPSVVHAILTGEPYPVRAIWALNNLLLALEDYDDMKKALMSLDFFVGSDYYMTPTMELCDLILPPCTYLEREENEHNFYYNYVAARQQAIEPLFEARNERWMDFEIIKRMGLETPKEFSNSEEYNDYAVKGLGITFNDLKERRYFDTPIRYKKYEENGFNTPTKKIELYSTVFEEFGYDPLPYYAENPQTPFSRPDLVEEFPLTMITGGRNVLYWHGSNVQLPWLREIIPYPELEIHPETAAKLGIRDGDWVYTETPQKPGHRVKLKAMLTEGIDPRVVQAPSHWYYPERQGREDALEANINAVVCNDPPYDPISGATPLRGFLCKVYRAED
ncbi:MAG: molybdopterin-dependent oxidoreductase [Chloroflexi bacterium]|nr:molybdopterin-dependent oxidoreductase [Chloroflexota bacterium]